MTDKSSESFFTTAYHSRPDSITGMMENMNTAGNIVRLAVLGLAEFFGTAILLFLSCTSCTMLKEEVSILHTSIAAGLAVTVAIQMFGHISGAHVNPVVTLAAFILGELSVPEVPVYIISQILGCLAGSGFHKLVTPESIYNATREPICVNSPATNLAVWQALCVEILLSIVLVIANCASWDYRNINKMDSVPLKIGLVVVALNVSAAAYTGASMNPARSFGPAVWNNEFDNHWIYWIGPTVGSLLATYFYKFAFTKGQ